MAYRKQLYLVLLLLVVLSTSLFAAAIYRVCNHLLRREVHRKVHSVANTAVLLLDPASVAAITNHGDEAKTQYAHVLRVLNAVRNANCRDDIWVDHIWTLVPHQVMRTCWYTVSILDKIMVPPIVRAIALK